MKLEDLDRVLDGARQAPLSQTDHDKLKDALHAMAAMLTRSRSQRRRTKRPQMRAQPPDRTWAAPCRGVHRRDSGDGPASEPETRHPCLRRANVYVQKEPRVLVRAEHR
jgi:hypothetical protein